MDFQRTEVIWPQVSVTVEFFPPTLYEKLFSLSWYLPNFGTLSFMDFPHLFPKRHTYICMCYFNLFCKDPTEVLKTWAVITTLSHSYSPVSSLFPFPFFSKSATKKFFFLGYVDVILKIIEYTFVCFSI